MQSEKNNSVVTDPVNGEICNLEQKICEIIKNN